MDKSIDFKALAAELAALEKEGKGQGHDLLIARVLHNMSPSRWKEFCEAYPSSNWGAIPLSSLPLSRMGDADREDSSLLEAELKNAIVAEKFTEQVERELLRLERVGGELSILACQVEKGTPRLLEKLNGLLCTILQEATEPCDSIARDVAGHPLVLLPGTGPVRSRHLCETLQKNFMQKAKALKSKALLALGLVSIGHGEKYTAVQLISKVQEALGRACQEDCAMFQIGPETLDERSTLVHSDEKRFLFFGGA